jgi:hypothetical protein
VSGGVGGIVLVVELAANFHSEERGPQRQRGERVPHGLPPAEFGIEKPQVAEREEKPDCPQRHLAPPDCSANKPSEATAFRRASTAAFYYPMPRAFQRPLDPLVMLSLFRKNFLIADAYHRMMTRPGIRRVLPG